MGRGANSERCLKWDGGGSVRNLSKTTQRGVDGLRQKLFVRERYLEGVTTIAPPPPKKKQQQHFNHTLPNYRFFSK